MGEDAAGENCLGGMSPTGGTVVMSPGQKQSWTVAEGERKTLPEGIRFRAAQAGQLIDLLHRLLDDLTLASLRAEENEFLRHRLVVLEEQAAGLIEYARQLLRLLSEDRDEDAAAESDRKTSGQDGITVVLVRGEESMTLLLRRMLNALGCAVMECDLAAAMEQIAVGHLSPDLVLVDQLHRGDGLMALLHRVGESVPEQPILLCSTWGPPQTSSLCDGLPLVGILQKPFTLRELAREIGRAARSRRKLSSSEDLGLARACCPSEGSCTA